VGTLLLAAIVVVSGKAGGIGEVSHVQWYYLLGGVLGAAYVFSALVLVSQIGAGAVAAATVTGQLTTSVVLDQIGFLGLDRQPITPTRVAGVLLLLAGTYLIVR
jgi:transporter family-2 protein